eukprot:gb/GECG01000388.1/.p1 GENE.gb/GECG01000388.1/~~gb/GECG01000388.1/.p1  ORF type:complete len:947 (+),score=140.06 gb/GECG01000388.1/:1-2841(+)
MNRRPSSVARSTNGSALVRNTQAKAAAIKDNASWRTPYTRAVKKVRDRMRQLGVQPVENADTQNLAASGRGPFGDVTPVGLPKRSLAKASGRDEHCNGYREPEGVPPLLQYIPPERDQWLTREGIRKQVSRLGLQLNNMEVSALFRSLDSEGRGRVSLSELQQQLAPLFGQVRNSNTRPATAGSRLQSYAPPQGTFESTQRVAQQNVQLPEAKDASYYNGDERGTLSEFRRRLISKLKSAQLGRSNRQELNATVRDDPFMHTKSYGDKFHEQQPEETKAWGRYSLHDFNKNRELERQAQKKELQTTHFNPEIVNALGLQGNKAPPATGRRPLSASSAYRDKKSNKNPFCLSFRDFCVYVRRELGLRLTPIALRKLYASFDPYGEGFVNLLDALPGDIVQHAQRGRSSRPPLQAWSTGSGESFERQIQKENGSRRPSSASSSMKERRERRSHSTNGADRFEESPSQQRLEDSSEGRRREEAEQKEQQRRPSTPQTQSTQRSGNETQPERRFSQGGAENGDGRSQQHMSWTQRYNELYNQPSQRAEEPFSFRQKEDKQQWRRTQHRADTQPAGLGTAQLNSTSSVSSMWGTTPNDKAHRQRVRNISTTIAKLFDEGKLPQPPATPTGEQDINTEDPNVPPNIRRAVMHEAAKRRQAREEAYEEAKNLDSILKHRNEDFERYKQSHFGNVDMKDATNRIRQQALRFEDRVPQEQGETGHEDEKDEQQEAETASHASRPNSAQSSMSRPASRDEGQRRWMVVYDSNGRPTKKRVDTTDFTNPKLLGAFTNPPKHSNRPSSAPTGCHHHHHSIGNTMNKAANLSRTLQIQGFGLQNGQEGAQQYKLPEHTQVKGLETGDVRATEYPEVLSSHHQRASRRQQNKKQQQLREEAENRLRNTHSVFRNTLREAMRTDQSEASSYAVSSASEEPYTDIPQAQRRVRVAKHMGRKQ